MADLPEPSANIALGIASLLREQSGVLSPPERAEVDRFLDAGEYGLALDTLCWILVEEHKPISNDTLRKIESLAEVMDVAREPFMDAVRSVANRQTINRDAAIQ
jgi:hypothetical protein